MNKAETKTYGKCNEHITINGMSSEAFNRAVEISAIQTRLNAVKGITGAIRQRFAEEPENFFTPPRGTASNEQKSAEDCKDWMFYNYNCCRAELEALEMMLDSLDDSIGKI